MAASIGRIAALAVALGIVAAGGAVAHDDVMPRNARPATKAAYARHENFRTLGAAFKSLNDELRKGAPNRASLASSARTINTLAAALPTWFPRERPEALRRV